MCGEWGPDREGKVYVCSGRPDPPRFSALNLLMMSLTPMILSANLGAIGPSSPSWPRCPPGPPPCGPRPDRRCRSAGGVRSMFSSTVPILSSPSVMLITAAAARHQISVFMMPTARSVQGCGRVCVCVCVCALVLSSSSPQTDGVLRREGERFRTDRAGATHLPVRRKRLKCDHSQRKPYSFNPYS